MPKIIDYSWYSKIVSPRILCIYRILAFFIISTFFIGCSPSDNCNRKREFEKISDYQLFISKSKNGLVCSRQVNGFSFEAKYIPPELCALEQRQSGTKDLQIDSLITQNKYSKTFLFTVQNDGHNNLPNLLWFKIESKTELKNREKHIDCQFDQHFKLKIGDNIYSPQLYTVDRTFVDSRKLVFRLKFIADSKSSLILDERDFALVFEDPYFETGISKFYFKKESIIVIPQLKKS
nr:hypothetical protein [uncultured Draconibacterium sp.]